MRYFLKRNTVDCINELDISEQDFNDLVEAKATLRKALEIEDMYEQLLASYVELEQDVLSLTVKHMVFHDSGYSEIHKKRSIVNRRIFSVLATAKLYVDRIDSETARCSGVEEHKESVKAFRSAEYESLREYRFVEALRNSVQHHSLPVHGMSFGSKWDGEKTENQYSSAYYANKVELAKNAGFKRSVLNETPERVDLLSEVRVYIAALSHVHIQVRGLIDHAVSNARQLIETHIKQYEGFDSGGSLGLVAVSYENDEKYEAVPILLDWDDVRLSLVSKNRALTNLERRFARS